VKIIVRVVKLVPGSDKSIDGDWEVVSIFPTKGDYPDYLVFLKEKKRWWHFLRR
jgi:hypothetical protein